VIPWQSPLSLLPSFLVLAAIGALALRAPYRTQPFAFPIPAAPLLVRTQCAVQPPAAAAAEIDSEPSPAAAARAERPTVWNDCVLDDHAICGDDGFPALSRDGKLLAVRHLESGPGRNRLEIQVLRARDAKLLRSEVIVSEHEEQRFASSAQDPALARQFAVRAAALQQQLEDRGFLPLEPLSATRRPAPIDGERPGLTAVTLNSSDLMLQIADAETGWVRLQKRYPPVGKPAGEYCQNMRARDAGLFILPDQENVLVTVFSWAPGCLCDNVYNYTYHIAHLAPFDY
jgi:hypothetical protein